MKEGGCFCQYCLWSWCWGTLSYMNPTSDTSASRALISLRCHSSLTVVRAALNRQARFYHHHMFNSWNRVPRRGMCVNALNSVSIFSRCTRVRRCCVLPSSPRPRWTRPNWWSWLAQVKRSSQVEILIHRYLFSTGTYTSGEEIRNFIESGKCGREPETMKWHHGYNM